MPLLTPSMTPPLVLIGEYYRTQTAAAIAQEAAVELYYKINIKSYVKVAILVVYIRL